MLALEPLRKICAVGYLLANTRHVTTITTGRVVAETVMSCDCENTISRYPDAERLLIGTYHEESLTELIIRAHTLFDSVITQQIKNKSRKPCKGKFSKKLKIYADLVSLPAAQKQRISAFAKLRNDVVHKLGGFINGKYEDERTWVWKHLPWKGESSARPDANYYVLLEALTLLKAL